jgi:diacylglycerol kinase family enzyme
VRGSLGSSARLAVLPFGTSNDLAVTLGIRRDADTLTAITEGAERAVDIARCRHEDERGREREQVLCTSGGLGFTARITQVERGRLVSTIKRLFGQPGWIPVCAALALSFPARRLKLRLDGRSHELDACLLELGKVVSIGGMPLLPRARLDGGYFDVCAFEGALPRRLQLLGSLQVSKSHIQWPDFEYFTDDPCLNSLGLTRVREVVVEPDGPFPLHLHGEFVGHGPATFRVTDERVRFLAPTGA